MNKFNVGDVILVKNGINDPDFGVEIEGWVGAIIDVEITDKLDLFYKIRWNKNTQDKMSSQLKKACSDMCLDHEYMYLLESDIELNSTGMGLAHLISMVRKSRNPMKLSSPKKQIAFFSRQIV